MPDVSLNGIEFQIKGSSDKASNSIDSLIKNLNSLKSALAATNSAAKGTGTFKELAVSIKDFNDALKGGSERYKKFAQGLEDIAAAAELLGEKTQHISDLATSMEKLSNSKISGAAFKNLADGMAAVGFATKFISKEALDNLERMATSLSKLAGVDLKGLGSAMNAVGRGKTLEPPSPVPSEIQDVINSGDQIDLLRLKLGELQTALQSAFEKGDLTGAIRIRQQIASVEAEIRKLEEAANEVVPTMGRFREALSSIGSFLGKYAGTAEKVFSAFGKVLAFPFTRAAKDIGGYAKSIWGVVSGFKRIVGYRLIRSIIREVTQAFSEGIKNLYGWSKAMGGATISGKNFAQTMDGLATSSLYFKNSIGAAVAPLISALAPAIDFVIDKVVALINVINQLLALLGGATSWNKAIRKANEFEDAAGGAGGAAKEALRYLAPFDELNRLPDNNKGGGGGGGTDYSGMFEEQSEFIDGLKDFVDQVKAAIDASDWEGLGKLLGDKVNELVEMIDFAGAGAKIGEGINAWFTTKYWTIKSINFENIGSKIAEFLNSALDNIDFEVIGRSWVQKFTIIPDMIIGFLRDADWSQIGKSIGDYLRGAFDEASDWIESKDWGEVVENIFSAIVRFVDGLDISSLLSSVARLVGTVSGAIVEAFGTLAVDAYNAFIDPNTWNALKTWFSDNFVRGIAQAGIDAANSLISPIQSAINSIIEKYNNIANNLGLPTIDPIDIKLIPDLDPPVGTLYDQTKNKWENESQNNPVDITVGKFTGTNGGVGNGLDLPPIEVPGKVKFNSYEKDADGAVEGIGKVWSYGKVWFNKKDVQSNGAINGIGSVWSYGKVWFNKKDTQSNGAIAGIGSVWSYGKAWFNKYQFTSGIETNGVNTKIHVTGQTNTPTIDANLKFKGNGGRASGGAFYGGVWHDIPQYASGGRPHGTMFVAGEAGPEIVGHVGGRTEVLNQSQLAATMYAAVRSALSGLTMVVSAPSASASGFDGGADEETMYRAFSRALADSDLGGDIELDGEAIYKSVVRRNRQNTRATGVNQFAMA